MRIVHVNYADAGGGAAIAAQRIVEAQRRIGLDASLLVLRRSTDYGYVIAPVRPWRMLQHRATLATLRRVLRLYGIADSFSRSFGVAGVGFGEWIRAHRPDVINLHWVGREMMSLSEIAGLPGSVFWTLHDMWALCGAEHYPAAQDERFLVGERGYTGNSADAIERWMYRRKSRHWRQIGHRLKFITPSLWLGCELSRSALLHGRIATVIPNCVDAAVINGVSRTAARSVLGISEQATVLLFSAASGVADQRKGFSFLREALTQLLKHSRIDRDRTVLLVVGELGGALNSTGIHVINTGFIKRETDALLAYRSADLLIVPSLQDNLPNTIIEAQACGTPCVAFTVGGIPEAFINGKTGILVQQRSAEALAEGIRLALDRPQWDAQAFQSMRERFGYESVAKQYRAVYLRD